MRKKLVVIVILIILLGNLFLPILKAINIEELYLKCDHTISNTHIMFLNSDIWHEIKSEYICYEYEGKDYPAYCISDENQGISNEEYNIKICSLLRNNLIYNTILNGYPYKTAKELGLNNNDEAYIATKQAIYCVILNRNVKEFYRAIDEEGEKIIEAIYNISENGKKMQEKSNKTIEIIKTGDIKKFDDNSYYQEFEVKSDAKIIKYKVKNKLGDKIYISDKEGNEKYSFNGSKKFRMIIPNECLSKDINFNIEIEVETNSRPILYGKASNNKYQDYAITFKNNIKNNISTLYYHKSNLSNIKILKYDEETNETIRNISFSLYDNNMNFIKEVHANDVGLIEFDELYKGEYFIKQTKKNNNYIEDDEFFEINIDYEDTVIKTITNNHKKGNLLIQNIDKDNNELKLSNIEYELFDEQGKYIKRVVSDLNGKIEIKNLNIGNYILKSINISDGYNLKESINILVEWNKDTEITVENEKKKGQIKIIKQDLENESIKLEGIEFEILDDDNNTVDRIKTNVYGEAFSNKLPIGKYKIRETNLNENVEYILNEEVDEIEIEEDVKTIVKKGEHKKGKLQILNIDEENRDLPICNSKFELTDCLGNKSIIETDNKGVAISEDIPTGKINIKLLDINSNYVLNEQEIQENIYENKINNIEITNKRKKGKIEINKYESENSEIKINGVEFQICDIKGNIVEKIITNNNGSAISKDIPTGRYLLKEVKTNKKYILNSEILDVEIENNKTTIVNTESKKIKGKIHILKTSSGDSEIFNIKSGQTIDGVLFDIYNENNILVDTITTNENGEAISRELEYGRYLVKEKNRKQNFLINTNIYFANISKENEIINIFVENEPIIPRISVKKFAPEYAEKNEEIKYEICVENKSNSIIENFELKEYIPYKNTTVTKLITGVYNLNVECNIYYKTNINDYKLLKTVNSLSSEYISFEEIKLAKKEKITEIKINYGNVEKDFISNINPMFYMKVNNNVKKKDVIINKVELLGRVEENILTESSQTETIIKEREIIKKLPNTGG